METLAITSTHDLWDKTIRFAENCSWRAGQYLAEIMRKNQFHDWERVFIAYDNNQIIGYCTFTEKDELSWKKNFRNDDNKCNGLRKSIGISFCVYNE